MDIWSWVEDAKEQFRASGELRLAEIMDDIPSFTCDNQHAKVDAIVNEGVQLARQSGHKWAEVFIRHWYLQSQVLHRHNVADMTTEAVDLLNFSNQSDTESCPQSICVVQDLTNCYGIQDGPGFARERLDVCEETLAKIDPSWPCYECIACEHIAAIDDLEGTDAAYKLLDEHVEKMSPHAYKDAVLPLTRAGLLIDLGRYADAEKFMEKSFNYGSGSSFEMDKQLTIILAQVHQKKYDDALASLPDYRDLLDTPAKYMDWCDAVQLMAKAGVYNNDAMLSRIFYSFANNLTSNGVVRDTITLHGWNAELAILRSDFLVAAIAIDCMNALLPKLAKDCGAAAQVQQVVDQLNAASADIHSAMAEVSPDDLLSEGPDEDAAQTEYKLHLAGAKWPENMAIRLKYYDVLDARCFFSQAVVLLEELADKGYESDEIFSRYGYALYELSRYQRLLDYCAETLEKTASEEVTTRAYWYQSLAYRELSQVENEHAALARVLEMKSGARNTRYRMAKLETDRGEYAAAIKNWNILLENHVATEDDEMDYHWERTVPATISENWDMVRESMQVLGIRSDEQQSGPVNFDMGSCRVQIPDTNGEVINYYAERTGPVSAVIKGLTRVAKPQYYNASVVFTPTALNELDQTDENGHKCDSDGYYNYIFAAKKVLNRPEYSYFSIDGVHPGSSEIEELKSSLAAVDVLLSVRSDDSYELFVEIEDEYQDLKGVYALLVVPGANDLKVIHHMLQAWSDKQQHPLIWPDLAATVGDSDALKRQKLIEEKYDI